MREGMNIKITNVIKQNTCLHDQVRYGGVGSTRYGQGAAFLFMRGCTRVLGRWAGFCSHLSLFRYYGRVQVVQVMLTYLKVREAPVDESSGHNKKLIRFEQRRRG